MAGKSTTLTVKIVSDASSASRGFDDAGSRVDSFSRGLDRASVASAGVLVGLGGLAASAFNAASDLQQSTGAIDSVFGDWALDIEQHAQTAADSVGLSTSAYESLASTVGATMKGMGQSNGEAMDSTTALIQTGADLAATFGGPTSDAVAALGSLMRGERDPIERYGISISAASVEAKIAAMGLDTSTDAALKNSTAVATMALVQEQAAGATGAFARESDTAAGAQARASAEFENAKAKLGEQLLPVVADGARKFGELTTFLVAHEDTVKKVVIAVGALAAGVIVVNAAVTTFKAVQTAATAAQAAFNLVLSLNPIMLVVLAVAALAAGVYLAYQKFEPFRTVVDAVGRALVTAFSTAVTWAQRLWDKIQPIIDGIGKIAGGIGGFVGGLFGAPTGPAPTPGAALRGAGLYGASAGGGFTGFGTGSAGLGTAGGGDTYHFTINGVLDGDDAADKIQRLLDRRARMTGRASAGAFA